MRTWDDVAQKYSYVYYGYFDVHDIECDKEISHLFLNIGFKTWTMMILERDETFILEKNTDKTCVNDDAVINNSST